MQLFGGALTGIGLPAIIGAASGMHMLMEYVIETTATLIPAAIAFTAFGAAATPTVMDLYKQMTSLYTATSALGAQMPGMTGGFSAMVAAAKPQVYELFGEAMYTASHSTGAFATMAAGAGKVLDDLGARMAYAVTQGKGVNTFAQTATSDLAGWGDSIGNIMGIFGNLLKVMPGYAEMILSVADSVGHLAEVITGSAIGQGILSIGLAAHGAIFYIGLHGHRVRQAGVVGAARARRDADHRGGEARRARHGRRDRRVRRRETRVDADQHGGPAVGLDLPRRRRAGLLRLPDGAGERPDGGVLRLRQVGYRERLAREPAGHHYGGAGEQPANSRRTTGP